MSVLRELNAELCALIKYLHDGVEQRLEHNQWKYADATAERVREMQFVALDMRSLDVLIDGEEQLRQIKQVMADVLIAKHERWQESASCLLHESDHEQLGGHCGCAAEM